MEYCRGGIGYYLNLCPSVNVLLLVWCGSSRISILMLVHLCYGVEVKHPLTSFLLLSNVVIQVRLGIRNLVTWSLSSLPASLKLRIEIGGNLEQES